MYVFRVAQGSPYRYMIDWVVRMSIWSSFKTPLMGDVWMQSGYLMICRWRHTGMYADRHVDGIGVEKIKIN